MKRHRDSQPMVVAVSPNRWMRPAPPPGSQAGGVVWLVLMLLVLLPPMSAWGARGVALKRVFASQPLRHPVHLAAAPDETGRMAVVEQEGRILWLQPGKNLAPGVLLDIRDRVSTEGREEGLLSLAFHPGFRENGTLFVYYSAAHPRRSIISRFRLPPGGTVAPKESEHKMLEIPQPYSNHNGGQIAFGPDGFLYAALGDGGSGGDPLGNGQNTHTLLGAILRIDINRTEGGKPYAIPLDNPFLSGGGRPEIWAYGLRNPWRFSFDRLTGALYAADVGQERIEEVNQIVKGGNYGWNIREGSACYRPPSGCGQRGLTPPITEYYHDVGFSITGGFVYRGRELPALQGRYLFGDFGSGALWSIPAGGSHPRKPEPMLATGMAISSFGEDNQGEVYVVDWQGGIYRMIRGG